MKSQQYIQYQYKHNYEDCSESLLYVQTTMQLLNIKIKTNLKKDQIY